jgi:hypothetical protein
VAQVVECLPRKRVSLSSNRSTTKEKKVSIGSLGAEGMAQVIQGPEFKP